MMEWTLKDLAKRHGPKTEYVFIILDGDIAVAVDHYIQSNGLDWVDEAKRKELIEDVKDAFRRYHSMEGVDDYISDCVDELENQYFPKHEPGHENH